MQELEPLSPKLSAHGSDTGDVAARSVQAGDDTSLDRVPGCVEDDRNRRGQSFGCEYRWLAACCDDGAAPPADQIGREFQQLIILISRPAVFNRDVAAFGVTRFA